ncbi:MAG: hypothetical protein QOE33_2941 [Acidobacteriota bacterium]|nr:hypothetical protein [Acidobacteriota bacterium]
MSSYVTMTATIPTYNKANPNLWTPTGQKTVQLALVGMHVVGSTVGHPEMIWATFEHFGNTPNAAYSYINTGNVTTNFQGTNTLWATGSNCFSCHVNNTTGVSHIYPSLQPLF